MIVLFLSLWTRVTVEYSSYPHIYAINAGIRCSIYLTITSVKGKMCYGPPVSIKLGIATFPNATSASQLNLSSTYANEKFYELSLSPYQ